MQVDLERLYGNQTLKETLAAKIRAGKAAHAYLLEGPEGSGRTTAALLLAAALCCQNKDCVPCGTCENCRKILSGLSPDLMILDPDAGENPKKAKSLGVEAVRMLRTDAYVRPNDLDRKLYIIRQAGRMTVQAQNALLKILEEPPETVIFFLLCESAQELLPTVRSRVQTLSMERFSDDELLRLLLLHEKSAQSLQKKDGDRLKLFVRLADGAYGKALFYLSAGKKQLAEDPVFDAHTGAEACLLHMFAEETGRQSPVFGDVPRADCTSLLLLLSERGDTRERLRSLLYALCMAVRDLTLCTVCTDVPLLFFSQYEQPAALSARCSRPALDTLFRRLTDLRAGLDSNPNVALVQAETAAALCALHR